MSNTKMHSISWLQRHWCDCIAVLPEASWVIQDSATPSSPRHRHAVAYSSRCQQCSWTVYRLKWAFVRSTAGRMHCLGLVMNMTLPSAESVSVHVKDWNVGSCELSKKCLLLQGMTFTCSLCSSDCPWGPLVVLPAGSEIQPCSATTPLGNSLRRCQGRPAGKGYCRREGAHVLEWDSVLGVLKFNTSSFEWYSASQCFPCSLDSSVADWKDVTIPLKAEGTGRAVQWLLQETWPVLLGCLWS